MYTPDPQTDYQQHILDAARMNNEPLSFPEWLALDTEDRIRAAGKESECFRSPPSAYARVKL